MRVYNNADAVSVWTDYTYHMSNFKASMQRLSSGLILPTDNPAGIAISERMRAEYSAVDSAMQNIDTGISMMQTSDSWMQKINDMLADMKSLSVQYGGITSQEDKETIKMEFAQYQDEIRSITSTSSASGKYNGIYLFRGGSGVTTSNDVVMSNGNSPIKLGAIKGLSSDTADSEVIALAGGGFFVSNQKIDGTSPGIQLYDNSGAGGTINLSVENIGNMVSLTDGGFITYSAGKFQRYTRAGAVDGAEVTLSSTENIKDVVALSNGDLVAVVGSGSSEEIVHYDFALSTSSIVSVSSSDDSATVKVVAVENDGFLLADGGRVMKYDSNGVVENTGFTSPTVNGDISDIISLKGGDFVAKYESNGESYLQRFNSNGTKDGDLLSYSDKTVQSLTSLSDGGYSVLFTDDQSPNKLQLNRYNMQNSLIENQQISTGRAAVSSVSSVLLSDDNLVVEWGENGRSYSRILDTDSGVGMQIGASVGENYTLGLPDLQSNNHEVIGQYSSSGTSYDVRWSTILDSSFTPGSANAGDALDVAIEHLSSQRAMTNSQENVLTHRKEALLTYQDNIASAEAKIRNVDMANESINYSRQEILVNTSKAMLAQANIMPLNILDLLPK